MAEGAATIACTITARNQLPFAHVLATSYLAHHLDHEFVVLVTDGVPTDHPVSGYQLVGPEALDTDIDDYLRMATIYTAAELASAVKPLLLRSLLTRAAAVVFLRPDIRLYAPLPDVTALAVEHDIVLTPRFDTPLPRDAKEPSEATIMGEGVFDLGFLAVGRGAKEFLDFWADRLRHDALMSPNRQMFADQRWADQIPALFRHHVLRDPGCGVAYWNMHERTISTSRDGTLMAGGSPLRFLNFSGYQPEKPWLLSRHCPVRPRIQLSQHPEIARLCDDYRTELLAAGYEEDTPYGYGTLADGTRISRSWRRMYRDAWVEAEQPGADELRFRRAVTEIPPHPFGSDGGEGFRTWLATPGSPPESAAGVNRLLMAVWNNRGDLQQAFKWPCGVDAAAFRTWCRTHGVREKMVPTWALPVEPRALARPVDEFGVNLVGYLTAELGLGEMGRIMHRAIEHADVPLASVSEEYSLDCRTELDTPDSAGRPRFPVTIMSVNADQTELLLASHPEVGHQRYRIGLWAWELEAFPVWQHMGFQFVDEVWTVSEFCAKAFAKHSPVPVKVIPVPVLDPGVPARSEPRDPTRPTQFFFAFDFNSTGQRKNPWGAVEAFKRAFPGRTDVRLVIKATNGKLHQQSVERLVYAIGGDPRIELMQRYLSVDELNQLYADSDCYVSLHRSEGFGLTVAEAMVRGMAVISTDYSSTTEFFSAEVGWPVPYQLVPVGPGWAPYQKEALWADPDLDAAAASMREIADDPAEARRRGQAAREYVLRTRSMDAAADWVRTQLHAAHRSWQSGDRSHAPEPSTSDPVMRPLEEAREAVRWRADTNAPSRNPLAPPLRRMVLRVLDNYDVHQRKVLDAIAGGVQSALGRLNQRVTDTDDRMDAIQRQLDQVERKLTERDAGGRE